MGKVKFSDEQQSVIDMRGANLLVSAAAGSGKTEVLAERIVELIMDKDHPVSIDRMVVLTFTEAAASEMRERVTGKLIDRLKDNPEDERLYAQSLLVQNALITTIDSFCLFIIHNNFSDIGIDPGFRVLDQGEKSLILKETFDEILEESLENGDTSEETKLILDTLTGRPADLEDMVLSFAGFLFSTPDRDEWIKEALKCYTADTEDEMYATPLFQSVFNEALMTVSDAVTIAKGLKKYCDKYADEIEQPDADAINNILEQLENMARAEDIGELIKKVKLFDNKSLGRKKYDRKTYISDVKKKIKGFVDDISKKKLNFNPETVIDDGKKMAGVLKAFIDFTVRFMDAFDAAKRDRNVIDFVDMERLALKILSDKDDPKKPSKTAAEYRDYFEVIMVDEYQDSNALQESILTKICRDNNYFMVGDVKQSIYRFRGACPDIFTGKYLTYGKEGRDIRIDLNKNYRSRSAVLDFANMIFENVMNRFTCGGIDYDDSARLYYGAVNYDVSDDKEPEVIFFDETNLKESGLSESVSSVECEAAIIAGRINALFEENYMVTEKDGTRRELKYSDIVILLRVEKDINNVIKEVLEKNGIPAYAAEKRGYFSATEVTSLLSYLSVLDNPRNDIDFYGVLTGDIGGFSPEEIAIMRIGRQKGASLYDDFAGCDDERFIQRKNRLMEKLERHGKMSKYMSLRELLEKILEDTDYLIHMTALPSGEKRRANILALLEKATDFEKTSYHGLFQFNRYIRSLRAREVDEGEAGTITDGDNVVRIMSMHKSKGLEFPVVFVSGLGKQYNAMDQKGRVLYDREYGMAADIIDTGRRTRKRDVRKNAVASVIKNADRAEAMRLIYVALTRAREKLIVTGCEKADVLDKMPKPGTLLNSDIQGYDNAFKLILAAIYNEGLHDRLIMRTGVDDLIITDDMRNREMSRRKEVLINNGGSEASAEKSLDPKVKKEYEDGLHPKYEGEYLDGLYIKTSVSAIKMKHYEETESFHREYEAKEESKDIFENEAVPSFAVDGSESPFMNMGAAKGSATHRVMELLDFSKTGDLTGKERREYITECIKQFDEKGLLEKGYRDIVDVDKCSAFFDTDLAKRMCRADKEGKLFKEKSFFLGKKASEIEKRFPDSENIIVQGIIDAYFVENGSVVIMDYKTDMVNNGDELADKYESQLELYKEAVERITGYNVSEMIIYSFRLDEEIPV